MVEETNTAFTQKFEMECPDKSLVAAIFGKLGSSISWSNNEVNAFSIKKRFAYMCIFSTGCLNGSNQPSSYIEGWCWIPIFWIFMHSLFFNILEYRNSEAEVKRKDFFHRFVCWEPTGFGGDIEERNQPCSLEKSWLWVLRLMSINSSFCSFRINRVLSAKVKMNDLSSNYSTSSVKFSTDTLVEEISR